MLQALTVSALTLIPALIVKADGKRVRLDALFIPEWMGYGYVSMCLWSTCVVTHLLHWARVGGLTTPGLVAFLCSMNSMPWFLCSQHGHVFRGLQLLDEDSEVYCSAPASDIGARYWKNLAGTRCELHAFDLALPWAWETSWQAFGQKHTLHLNYNSCKRCPACNSSAAPFPFFFHPCASCRLWRPSSSRCAC
jgi:hypothetical protein